MHSSGVTVHFIRRYHEADSFLTILQASRFDHLQTTKFMSISASLLLQTVKILSNFITSFLVSSVTAILLMTFCNRKRHPSAEYSSPRGQGWQVSTSYSWMPCPGYSLLSHTHWAWSSILPFDAIMSSHIFLIFHQAFSLGNLRHKQLVQMSA